jgi:hypothetical protein
MVGVLLLSYLPARAARDHLQQGRQLLVAAKGDLLAGKLDDALQSFNRANDSFIMASSDAGSPLLAIAGAIPVLGRTPDTVRVISEAGQLVAQAGEEITQTLRDLPQGLDSLAPTRGRIPIETLSDLEPGVSRASLLVRGALRSVKETSGSFLFAPVAGARAQALTQLDDLDRALSSATLLLRGAPAFLGADEPVSYFFGAQNPAELRGTGGLMGAFSILAIDDGRLSFSPFQPIQTLPNLGTGAIEPPSREFAKNYNAFGGAGFWLNLNMTPDFPTAASAIEHLYRANTGQRVNGVIVADPYALKGLLGATGPVRIRKLATTVTSGNVVAYTSNQAYAQFASSSQRKEVLGDVARAVFGRFMSADTPAPDAVRALAQTVGGGHLQISTSGDFQRGLRTAGADGALRGEGGDFLDIAVNNGGGNKVDYYADRSVTYSVRLGADGTALADANVRIGNNAPTSGEPQYVIGPFVGASGAGENVSFVTMYCSDSCELRSLEKDGVEFQRRFGTELGYRYFQAYVRTPSGHTSDLDYALALPDAWDGDESAGTYRLTYLNQPTIRPTEVRIEIQAPDGMNITSTSLPMSVEGNRAVWSGTPSARLSLQVSFGRPLPQRVWHDIVDFLDKPLF